MDTKDWIAVGVAFATIASGWCQFWVKERLLSSRTDPSDPLLNLFKSGAGVSLLAFSGVLSVTSLVLLLAQVTSTEPLTRISCFAISGLTAASILNAVLVQGIFTLRRLALMRERIEEAKDEAIRRAIFFNY